MITSFKHSTTFEERCSEAIRIRDKFPGRIPVIVERADKSLNIPAIDKQKFLVPGDLTVSQFVFVIRKRINLSSETALFLFVGGMLPTTGMLMRELYSAYAEADHFLYAVYSGESCFG